MKKNINTKIFLYKNFFKKFKGLMFVKNSINYGILLKNVNSIHTFFCMQKIDIIMLDKSFKVLYLFSSFSHNKIILPKKNVYYTLELPNDFIIKNNIKLKDTLILTNLVK